jgi:hypothetical protein
MGKEVETMRNRNISRVLAGVWFTLSGLIPVLNIQIANQNLIMALLAVATGVLLLLGR